jgi:hypothetical protein
LGGVWKLELNRFEALASPAEGYCAAAVAGLLLESCFEATSQTEAPHPGPLNSKARRIAAGIGTRVVSGPLISPDYSRVVSSSEAHDRVEGG